jgi:aminomethyltransferase
VDAKAEVRDVSDETALLALQGPRALQILAAAGSSIDVAQALPSFRLSRARVAGVDCTLARTGYTGEDGVEVFCAWGDAVRVWRALAAAGSAAGLEPAGLGARDTLRLEVRLSLYGNEIDESTNPFEAGLGWTVKLDGDDFIGRAALRALKAQPLSRKLCGFEMVGKGIARHGYALLDEAGASIGVCTSGGPSPTLGVSIGLGYVPPERAAVGASLWVDCRGKRIEARVVRTPFYRRPQAR